MHEYIYACFHGYTFVYVLWVQKLLPSLSVLLACIHNQTHNITRNHPLHETQNKILYNIKRKCDV